MNKKLITAASIALAACVAIGGTIAYLTDKTDTITNTFTVGKVNVTLTEETGADNGYEYHVLPGQTTTKDPKVSVAPDDEDSYVFVKVEASESFKEHFDWSVNTGEGAWTAVPDTTDVYYIAVDGKQGLAATSVLTGDEVTLSEDVKGGTNLANDTLAFTAYAIQRMNGDKEFTPAEAWAAVQEAVRA
mgnify:CR=1 FL=1